MIDSANNRLRVHSASLMAADCHYLHRSVCNSTDIKCVTFIICRHSHVFFLCLFVSFDIHQVSLTNFLVSKVEARPAKDNASWLISQPCSQDNIVFLCVCLSYGKVIISKITIG